MAHILSESFSEATRTLINEAPNEHSIDHYQGQLIEHIQVLEAEIRSLKYRHNAVSVTCRLPPNILSSIFLAVLDITGRNASRSEPVHDGLEDGCVGLWTKLHIWERSYIEAVPSRCRTAPLSVKFPWFSKDTGEPERLLEMVMPYIGQFRVVDMYWPSTPITGLPWYDALVKWNRAVPVLEELHLNKAGLPFGCLPAAILQGGAPNLRKLVVDNYHLPWPGALMSDSLTKLVLRGNAFSRSRPLATDFLGSLGKLKRLETLELQGYIPKDFVQSNQSSKHPCLLPALQHLQITDDPELTPNFFKLVGLPESTTQITLAMEPDHCSYGLTDYGGSCIGHTLRNLKQSFEWENRIRGPAALTLKLYFKADISTTRSVDEGLCLAFQLPAELPPIDTCLSIFDTHLNLSNITSLDIKMDPFPCGLSAETWTIISRLPNLNTLCISGPHAGILQHIIKEWEVQLQSSTALGPCFPSLSNLTLLGIEIAGQGDGSPRSLTPQLVTVLKAQAATGNSVSRLHIQDCWQISEADYLFAKETLPEIKIEWDRHGERRDPVDYLKVDIGWGIQWGEGT
ncbi:hypothetical protein FA13DRAFT_1808220 [Coprinellus micaceus]|uniref:F-box domain-containing protein n=1 Tax=Coprinellus micaceus TaxID=71717 RepID=A0A4Y7U279_COPMI|nr:hypothetical protein FA13DRAFT_1808220 [Coprinellus micaceus]